MAKNRQMAENIVLLRIAVGVAGEGKIHYCWPRQAIGGHAACVRDACLRHY